MTEFDRGPMTSGVRIDEDQRTHIERISPMIPGATYAEGIGAAPVFHGRDAEVAHEPDPEPKIEYVPQTDEEIAGYRLACAVAAEVAAETIEPIESDHD